MFFHFNCQQNDYTFLYFYRKVSTILYRICINQLSANVDILRFTASWMLACYIPFIAWLSPSRLTSELKWSRLICSFFYDRQVPVRSYGSQTSSFNLYRMRSALIQTQHHVSISKRFICLIHLTRDMLAHSTNSPVRKKLLKQSGVLHRQDLSKRWISVSMWEQFICLNKICSLLHT